MKRGFEILKTREVSDPLNVGLSGISKNDIPPLYLMFLETFYTEKETYNIDRFYDSSSGDLINCNYIEYSPNPHLVLFDEFIPVQKSFELLKSTFLGDEVCELGYLPVVQTASNVVLYVGTRNNEIDKIIIDTERRKRFEVLHDNIFEFVRGLSLKETSLVQSEKIKSLTRKWEDTIWYE